MRFLQSQQDVFTTLKNPKTHSSAEVRRAYLFLAIYAIALVATFLSWFHFVGAWVAVMAVQLVELIFTIMYALTINDYLEKHATAMECERQANPLVDAYLAIRLMQLALFLWNRNYVFLLVFLVAFGIALAGLRRGHVYVDATDLWRNAKASETISWFVLIMEVMLVVAALIGMVFSLMFKYA